MARATTQPTSPIPTAIGWRPIATKPGDRSVAPH
jgi:hypothetical protein